MMSEILDLDFSMNAQLESFGEFDQPSPLRQTYCRKITEEQFEDEAANETEKALNDLVSHLEQDQTSFRRVLRKRKLEDIESGSLFNFLKVKFYQKIQGEKFEGNKVSDAECEKKLIELKSGMLQAFNYSQEAKGRRFSKRLAAKQGHQTHNVNDENVPPPHPPPVPPPCGCGEIKSMGPPPPPPPPPPPGPRQKFMTSTPVNFNRHVSPRRPLKQIGKSSSNSSLSSIHDEILSTNPLQRLKPVKRPRSPGGTPLKKKAMRRAAARNQSDKFSSPHPLNRSESISEALLRIMEEKFRNIRTPSPANRSNMSPSFVTSPGFTP